MKRLFFTIYCLLVSLPCLGQSFTTKNYPVGSGPAQLIVADFNGDHIPDLAAVNTESNTVSVLINNGDGTFRPQLEFATGPSPVGLAAVDWNKDGKMDLIVANSGGDAAHSVSILIGNGDGSFQPHRDITGAPNANSIAVGDFNHDGNPDIATASNSPVNAVYVSLGDGHGGTMAQKVTSGFGQKADPGANPFLVTKIAWADYNRDGKDDLYYIQCCGGFDIKFGAWGVLIGNGDGTFTDHLVQGNFFDAFDLISVDINQDGLSDVLIPYTCVHDPCLGVVGEINNSDGNFNTIPQFGGIAMDSADIPSAAAFDINGDGLKAMVSVANFFFGFPSPNVALAIAQQHADGTFDTSSQLPIVTLDAPSGRVISVVVGDFNHDGRPDLAFLENGLPTVWVALNTTPPSPCLVRTANHAVTVCHPADGAVGTSPAHIVSHATSSTPVDASQIYLDFNLVFQVPGANIDTNLPLAPGNHRIEVKSWIQGKSFRNDFFLSTIEPGAGPPPSCTVSANFTVNICSPGQKANVNSPVHVVAAAKSTAHVTTMQIYLDSRLVFHEPNTSEIDTDLPVTKGMHFLAVKAWDSTGRSFLSSREISVQ